MDKAFIKPDGIYLLNHSVGLLPAGTRRYVDRHFFDIWESQAQPWNAWIEETESFKTSLGRLLNAAAGDFCPQTNISSAITKILYSLPDKAGRKTLVLSEQDFPSTGFVFDRARLQGYRVKFIPRDADLLDTDTWKAYLSDDVLCVFITHVLSNTSARVPVGDITALAAGRGIVSIVDIAQSVGVVPIDLQRWQADFVVGSCVKWLCGGPGAGYLWANPAMVAKCNPVDVGWFSHENPFAFDIHDFRYAADARRFWGGTPAVLPFVVADHSIQVALSVGIEKIRAHNIELTRALMDAVDPARLRTPPGPGERGGTVVVDFADRQPLVEQRLKSAGVHFDSRASGIRLSPHIYTGRAEIDTVVACLPVS